MLNRGPVTNYPTRGQRQELDAAISNAHLTRHDFAWTEADATFAGETDSLCPMLYHKSNLNGLLYFRFALGMDERSYDNISGYNAPPWNGRHCCQYAPDGDGTIGQLIQGSWSDIMFEFRSWLEYVKREVAAVDPWEMDDETRDALTSRPMDGDEHFDAAERSHIYHRLDLLLSEVRRLGILEGNTESNFAQLVAESKEAAGRMTKKDWKIYVLGLATSFVLTNPATPAVAHQLGRLIAGSLSLIFGQPLLGQ